jgi:hypothetical protein
LMGKRRRTWKRAPVDTATEINRAV